MMGNSVSAALPLQPDDRPRTIGGSELARGMMLVRASTIKILRLHLAMERRDRRLVLETMDDLAALDRKMRDFVEAIPAEDGIVDVMRAELEEQGDALAREKWALAAGIVRRGESEGDWAEAPVGPAPVRSGDEDPPGTVVIAEAGADVKVLLLGESDLYREEADEEPDAATQWLPLVGAAMLLAFLTFALAAYLFGGDAVRNLAGLITEMLGG